MAGPWHDDNRDLYVLEYNVRTLEGPYRGSYTADIVYTFENTEWNWSEIDALYEQTTDIVEDAFPEAEFQRYDRADDVG